MLTQIKAILQKMFASSCEYQSDLERFIISKQPSSTAELEHWTREFDRRSGGFYG